MSVKRGIDISAHQGDINLSALKSQIDFVIIRVGFGTSGTLDKKFKRNADLCKTLGIPFGFYWYSYAFNENGAEKEAKACLKAIEPYKDSYTMGVWFDMEDADGYKRKYGMPSNQILRNMCAKFCKTVEDAGYYSGIYASQSWFNNQLRGNEIAKYDKWVAQWPSSNGKQRALNVKSTERSDVHLWQFTSDGRFSGYNGRLDTNYAYIDNFALKEKVNIIKKSTAEIVKEVLAGKWGNGDERKRKLEAAGYNYNEIQNEINKQLQQAPKKSIEEIAKEVIAGQWGNGAERQKKLEQEGYDYKEVQKKVNELLIKNQLKSIDEIAQEVIAGKWGNGAERMQKLTSAGYNYIEVQKKVTELLSKKKTIIEIANEVIAGKWGNGTERRIKLEAAGYNYEAVQKKVAEILNK